MIGHPEVVLLASRTVQNSSSLSLTLCPLKPGMLPSTCKFQEERSQFGFLVTGRGIAVMGKMELIIGVWILRLIEHLSLCGKPGP